MQSNSSPQGICDDVIFTGSQTISVLPFFFSLNLQNANKLLHQRFFFFKFMYGFLSLIPHLTKASIFCHALRGIQPVLSLSFELICPQPIDHPTPVYKHVNHSSFYSL